MTPDREKTLDEALITGKAPDDAEVVSLVESARRLRDELQVDPPNANRERALFVGAVEARRRRFPVMRVAIPVLAAATLLAFLGLLGRESLPGDNLYVMRQAMAEIGIVRTPAEEADLGIAAAERAIERADDLVDVQPERARRLAVDALVDLGRARIVAGRADAEERVENIVDLEEEALDVIVEATEEAARRAEDVGGGNGGPGGEGGSGPDDSSGPGSGGGDDSGPGSSGSGGGDDNSGPGGGRDDDSSGPGSGGGDDNSGPGGGVDSSGSGSSGSGSSGSGGGDDNDGPG